MSFGNCVRGTLAAVARVVAYAGGLKAKEKPLRSF
jgi:hypothetical protein